MSESPGDKGGRAPSHSSGPSTNREAVPSGLEGSIMEPEQAGEKRDGALREKPHGDPLRRDHNANQADRAEGNERRSDEN